MPSPDEQDDLPDALAIARSIDLDALDPIQRTLAIPLIGRAHAADQFPALGFSDPAAQKLVERVKFSGSDTLARDKKIVWGSIVRTQAFDEIARDFAARFEHATAVSLGVGLCTRALRVPSLRWIEVDVPEVLAARDALLPAGPDTVRIACDLSADGALDAVLDRALEPGGPALILAEGLLMFLQRDVHHGVLSRLDRRLPKGSEVAFDYIHPIICRLAWLHGSLRTTGANYHSGFWPSRDLAAFRRLAPHGLRRFRARLDGALRLLSRALSFLFRSPLYEIACLRVTDAR